MARQLPRGATAILSLVIRDEDGAAKSPSVSTVVTLTDPDGTALVSATAMANDATGEYHTDYTIPGDAVLGSYKVKYTATNGSPARVTIYYDSFEVVE